MLPIKHKYELSYIDECRPNNNTITQRYLYSRKPVCCTGCHTHTHTHTHIHTHTLSLINVLITAVGKEISCQMFWIVVSLYISVVVCTRARPNTAQLVKYTAIQRDSFSDRNTRISALGIDRSQHDQMSQGIESFASHTSLITTERGI